MIDILYRAGGTNAVPVPSVPFKALYGKLGSDLQDAGPVTAQDRE
jgi:hypothetical protein